MPVYRPDGQAVDNHARPVLQALYSTAVSHHRSGDLAQAEATYREILKLDNSQSDAKHLLGVVCGHTGRADRGIELIEEALSSDPVNPAYHSNLANILRREGKLLDALEHYRSALEADPDFADAHANMAGALISAELFPQAEATARRALELAPDHPIALANLGGSLVAQHRFSEAEEYIRSARAQGGDSPDIWLNTGYMALAQGEFENAEAAFRTSLERDPHQSEAHRGLGFALIRLNRVSDSRDSLQQFIDLQPDPSSASAMLAHIEMNYGDFDKGFAMMIESLERPGVTPSENSTFVFNLNYAIALDQPEICAYHRDWQDRHARNPIILPTKNTSRAKSKPTRFGFVSPDFKGHSVSFSSSH